MTDRKPARRAAEASPPVAPAEALDFDGALARLEAIVQRLDGGTLGLEESLAEFEEGVGLTRRLSAQLDAAERRIEVLSQSEDESVLKPLEQLDAGED